MNGAKREIVDNVPCGNIVGISGVKSSVGETVTLKESEPFEQITHIFDPVITKSIEAKSPAEVRIPFCPDNKTDQTYFPSMRCTGFVRN